MDFMGSFVEIVSSSNFGCVFGIMRIGVEQSSKLSDTNIETTDLTCGESANGQ